MQTQTIESIQGRATQLYRTADAAGRSLLEELLGKETLNPDMTLLIKSFEDACRWNGTDSNDPKFTVGEPHTIARTKAEEIAAALRNGVHMDWNDSSQPKHYAWMQYIPGSGFRFYGTFYDLTVTCSTGGSRLCFPTAKLARYFAETFTDLINQYL